MGRTILAVLRDIVLLLARVTLGGVLLLHGWERWGGGAGIAHQVEYLHSQGVGNGLLLAWGSTILELAGGAFLVFGALTPVVAAAVVAEQVTIIVLIAAKHGPFVHDKGWEYHVVLAAFALVFVVLGAGRAAVDNLLRRPDDEKTTVDDPDSFPGSRP